jgi:hypothetical protein
MADVNAVSSKKAALILVTVLGTVIDVKPDHWNTEAPMLVTELGIVNDVNAASCSKALLPILDKELERVNEVNEVSA